MLLRQFVLSVYFVAARSSSAPAQCVHVTDGEFKCDYATMGAGEHPIDFTAFDLKPQRLDVSVNGIVPYLGDNQIFSATFSGIDTATFDSNTPISLNLDCGWRGGMYLYSGAFADMSHVQHFSIRNCELLNLPNEAFKDFENLDYFKIENGNIDVVNVNAWVGLNVERLTSDNHAIPRNLGKFEILYTRLSTVELPSGLLFNMKNLTEAVLRVNMSLALEKRGQMHVREVSSQISLCSPQGLSGTTLSAFRGLNLEKLTRDVFQYNTKIKYIDVSDNLFTSLPKKMFDLLESLSEVQVANIPWDCTCEKMWFVPYGIEKNISFHGDLRCSFGDGVFKYYYENCVSNDPCDGVTGIVMGSKCVSILAIIVLLISLASAVISTIALVLIAMFIKKSPGGTSKEDSSPWSMEPGHRYVAC